MEQTATTAKKPTALCLGGGGAKAAFQVGAWQAAEEAGLTSDIQAVAGCSVGALNAVLFALGDADYAKRIWAQIQPSDLLAKGTDGAFFSRDGLIRMINMLPLERIGENGIRVYVSVHHIESNLPAFFELNGQSKDVMRTLLLASSAIPHIYSPERYLGADYIDGSATPEGDLCISPVYHLGHRNILMISNRPQLSLYGGQSVGNDNLLMQYPDADFTLLKPLRPMGNLLTGTLSFAPEKISSRIAQGYNDAKAELSGQTDAPQTKEAVNAALVQKMQQLFPTGVRLSDFINKFGSRFAPNITFPTMGGNIWYDNIFEVDGWRLQQQRVTGLQSHYRILDPNNVRVAWVLTPQKLLDALNEYETQQS